MKFTDEELSRILSAAAIGGLIRVGARGTGLPCCMVQAGRAMHGLMEDDEYSAAIEFDRLSRRGKLRADDPDALLQAMEGQGWA